jgi:DNA-binding Lrp family transcriptional regulator
MWRDKIKVHPAAELFPMMGGDLSSLAKDIQEHGLTAPVIIWTAKDEEIRTLREGRPRGAKKYSRAGIEFYLLDGRNRMEAADKLGLLTFDDDGWPIFDDFCLINYEQPITILGPGIEPFDYVISANIHRRHLTAEQKRELIAKLLQAKPEQSNRQIAETVKASPTTVGTVRSEMEKSGDVSKLDTRTDTKGRQQPAAKPKQTQREAVGTIARINAQATSRSRVEYIAATWKRDASGLEVAKIVLEKLKHDMPAADVEGLRQVLEQFIGDGQ